jgi:hypothetical protein
MVDLDKLLEDARKAHGTLHGIEIRGPGWSGNAREGFIFNPQIGTATDAGGSGSGGGGPPPPATGACCLDGGCSILSSADCIAAGGNYFGDGVPCDAVDCTLGACCDGGDCSLTTAEGCAGDFQGYGTVCDPNPCSLPPCNECDYAEFGTPSDPPRFYRNYSRIRIGTYNFDNVTTDVQYTMTVNEDLEKHKELDEFGNCVEITDTDNASSTLLIIAGGVTVTDCNHPFDTDCWTDTVPVCGDPDTCIGGGGGGVIVDSGDHQHEYNDCNFTVGDPQECHYEYSEHIDEYLTDECTP